MKKLSRNTIYGALNRQPVHPFPARMAPDIALKILSKKKKPIRVLDPMMGSGTVIAIARSQGHQSIGVDIDPLAVLISRVWTTAIDTEKVRQKAAKILKLSRKRFASMSSGAAYPLKANASTKKFIRYWFDDYARRQLSALANEIHKLRDENTKNVLWCAFSRLIITKKFGASLAMDLAHSRPHKFFDKAPTKPFQNFLKSVDRVIENCISITDDDRGPSPSIREGDARKLKIRASSIDMVLTSPPYLNAIDYMRCSKFTLVWMGYLTDKIRDLRADSIGAERGSAKSGMTEVQIKKMLKKLKLSKLEDKQKGILIRFITDLKKSVAEVARVLVPGGHAIYVVGENTIKGRYIRNAKILEEAARRAGLRLCSSTRRTLPQNRRYLPPPRKLKRGGALDGRMRREVILTFQRPKTRA